MTDIVPPETRLAAKRGFIRTTAQAYAATLTTGISASIVLGVVSGSVELIPTVITLAVALVSPLLAGGASYLSIIAKGLPDEYIEAGFQEGVDFAVAMTEVDPRENGLGGNAPLV